MGESLHHHAHRFQPLLTTHCQPSCLKYVLLIEDNIGDVVSIEEMLCPADENAEFCMVHANSLAMGLAHLKRSSFDAVLLDLELPDSQGFETLLRLQQAFPDVPIVVLTDLADDSFVVRLIQQGAQGFLLKKDMTSSWLKSTLALSMNRFKDVTQQQQQQQQLEQSNRFLYRQIGTCIDEVYRLRKELKSLAVLAATDSLTGIANRYGFEQCLEREWNQAYSDQKPLSLIMIDIDYFKQFNDSYGHVQGDICLKRVAQLLQQHLQHFRGMVARYGGEEFVAILPNTPVQSAIQMAEKLRIGIQALAIHHPNSRISRWVTASLGIASVVPTASLTAANLLHEADQALYSSKQQGRDRVACFQPVKVAHETLCVGQ
ncbi:MAG: diguanylate cyclase [Cyanobacteria bacterium P01_D01_bin.156]